MEQLYTKRNIERKIKSKAKYIIRFDDICPTMNWGIWDRVENILTRNNIKPIVAVIPNNGDKSLIIDNEKEDFWERVLAWQKNNWAIALHGYNHVYENKEPGFLGISCNSEFASLPYEVQKEKIGKGIEILKSHGINTYLWIAPSHSFDNTTLEILRNFEINMINDGFSRKPYIRDGFIWIPCQMWDNIIEKKNGIWTVCIHPNNWNEESIVEFEREINKFSCSIISINDINFENVKEINAIDYLIEKYNIHIRKIKRIVKGLVRK